MAHNRGYDITLVTERLVVPDEYLGGRAKVLQGRRILIGFQQELNCRHARGECGRVFYDIQTQTSAWGVVHLDDTSNSYQFFAGLYRKLRIVGSDSFGGSEPGIVTSPFQCST